MNLKHSAFTLVELMVAITIIAIISGISIFGLTSIRQKAQDTSHLSAIKDLQLSLEAYKSVNGKYPVAGTQGGSDYIVGLTPTFMSKLPTVSGQSSTYGFSYTTSSDNKTYCVYVKGAIFKPESQSDMYSATCPKTWTACKGIDTSTLSTCD
jgi:prepilin-type N-terminal cleavage/methylation domain-containing protein